MASKTPIRPVAKQVRVILTEDQWRELRIMAAEDDVSITRKVASILVQSIEGK